MKTISTYQINVQEPYLTFIKSGRKTVEGRLNKGKFKEMQVGDKIQIAGIVNLFRVKNKQAYKTFLDMVTQEGFEKVIPDKKNYEDAANVYYKFFTKQQEAEFGVVAIEIGKVI